MTTSVIADWSLSSRDCYGECKAARLYVALIDSTEEHEQLKWRTGTHIRKFKTVTSMERVGVLCFSLFAVFSIHLMQTPVAATLKSTSTSTSTRQSFYRRPLPDSCTAFSSKNGRLIFSSALASKGLKSFFPLMEQYSTQSEPAYCGISTLVIALNAFAIDPRQTWKGPWRWYEESMLNCCLDLEEAKQKGVTLKAFSCLAVCQGIQASVYYTEEERVSENHFRETIKAACVESEGDGDGLRDVVVVSYTRKTLGQTGTGHFSPIAAFDSVSDSVLILDTARFKYGAHWVPLSLLYEAMQPVDPDTGRSRGYVLLSNEKEEEQEEFNQLLLQPIILRSRMKQNPIRRGYKAFLGKMANEPSWDNIWDYWTVNGTSPRKIWQMLGPQFKPCKDENETLLIVDQVLTLVDNFLRSKSLRLTVSGTKIGDTVCQNGECRPNYSRTLHVRPEQAIFIVFLASLPRERRLQIIFDEQAPSATQAAREQLLAEADLVEYTIETSDQAYF
jgi:glutathione gamma-glutamylcysteinyltransferase